MKVLFGFNNDSVIREVVSIIEDRGISCDYSVAKTKIDVFVAAAEDEELDTVVLVQKVEGESDWTATEIAKLNDARDLNIVVFLDSKLRGTQFSKILYSAGVRGVIFGDVQTERIAELIMKKQTDTEALMNFGFRDMEWKDRLDNVFKIKDITMDLSSVSGLELDLAKYSLSRSTHKGSTFDYICAGLNDEQIINLEKKLNENEKKDIRKSYVLKNIHSKNQKAVPSYNRMPVIRKFDDKSRNILFGFKNVEVVNKIESTLKEEGYSVKSAVRYSKREVLNTLNADPTIDTVVVIENIEMRGGYSRYELGELVKDRDINLIVLLESTRKGTDYVSYLYSCGVTSIVFNPAQTVDIIELIKNPRTREQAREFYGMQLGRLNDVVLCDEYVESILAYLRRGDGTFGLRYDRIKNLLDKSRLLYIKKHCDEDLIEKINNLENKKNKPVIIKGKAKSGNTKQKKVRERNVLPAKAEKAHTPDKGEDSDKNSDIKGFLLTFPKKYIAGLVLCFMLLVWGIGSLVSRASISGEIETVYNGEDVIYIDGSGETTASADETTSVQESTVVETTEAVTAEEITTEEETTEVETTKKVKKKKKNKKETEATTKAKSNSSNNSSNSNSNSSSSNSSTKKKTKTKKEKIENYCEQIEGYYDEKIE